MTTCLLVDFGNSRMKWARAKGDSIEEVSAIEHFGDPGSALTQIPDAAIRDVQVVWLANVTGPFAAGTLRHLVDERWHVELREASVRQGMAELQVSYADPARLGVDRWLMMLALWREHRGPFVVAGAGTALTFDAVDSSGQHLGGVIAPGLSSLQRAVLDSTRFAMDEPRPIYTDGLGRDTDSCVRQGALHSAAGLLDRLAMRFGTHPAGRPNERLFLAGGDAEELSRHVSRPWRLRPHLVLEGLLALARLRS